MEKAEGEDKDVQNENEGAVQDDLNNNDTDNPATDEEDLNLGDTSIMTVSERNDLFQRALVFEQSGKLNQALKCYLGCIDGLKSRNLFVLLPQCLHNIANIYREQNNYEQAIHFAQAEKLFYETSLVETEDIQKKIEEISPGLGDGPVDLNDLNIQALMAEEYEHLAKLCLDKKQQQLALEYAAKSTKLRQAVYGRDHEKTRTSLNMFAALYAEVGKLQYSDSINLLNDASPVSGSEENNEQADKINLSAGEPVSILRQRSDEVIKEDVDKGRKKQVHFHESVDESEREKEKDGEGMSLGNWLIFFVALVIAIFLMIFS